MSEACIGCKSLRYNSQYVPYCISIQSIRCYTLPKCPCHKCLVKVTCDQVCEEFEKAAYNRSNYIREVDVERDKIRCDVYRGLIARNNPILVRLDNKIEKRAGERKKGILRGKRAPEKFIKLPGLMNNYIRVLDEVCYLK